MESASNSYPGPLQNGQTVVVVGGGPAGTSCAIKLLHLASAKGISLNVMLYESKHFAIHPNVCVGVLSPPFQKLLGDLGLTLPQGIVQRLIKGYMLHCKRQSVYLTEQATGGDQTVVVDRADLDSLLLQSVRDAGGIVSDDAVLDVVPEADKVLVVTARGARVHADVVVGAFGLDKRTLSVFESKVPGFRPPTTIDSIMTDIQIGEETITERLDGTIHALLTDQLPRIEFGALTPKRNHVTVNIAGENIDERDLDAFLRLRWCRKLVPEATLREPRFRHAFPSSPAHNFYCDRIITIGNTAGMLRPLKGKGINTGLITGMEAARTMMDIGVSKPAFDEFYRRCHNLTSEFTYGVFLRRLYRLGLKLDMMDAVLAVARHEPVLYRAFYDMVSGEGSYKDIILRSARPAVVGRMVLGLARHRLLGK